MTTVPSADTTEAIRLDPTPITSHPCWAYKEKGEYDGAIADASAAIRLDPAYAFAYATRAGAYQKKGEYNRALPTQPKAIRLNRKNSRRTGPGQRVSTEGRSRAIARRPEAIRINPEHLRYNYGGPLCYGKLSSALQQPTSEIALRLIRMTPGC